MTCPVDADLADLARRTADRLAPQFEDSGVALTLNVDTSLLVHVDPDRIAQVPTNLFGNALLATPAGGAVTITARGANGRGEVVVVDTEWAWPRKTRSVSSSVFTGCQARPAAPPDRGLV